MRQASHWEAVLREEHDVLEEKVRCLEWVLHLEIGPEDLWVTLRHLILDVKQSLEAHLEREEAVFFPALIRLIGEEAGAVRILQEQHEQLRAGLAYLLKLRGDQGTLNLREVAPAADSLLALLREHEKLEDRLLLDVLKYSMKQRELAALAERKGI